MNTPLACLALIAASALTAPALADGGVTVKLPPTEAVAKAASPDFLTQLVMANVVGMNCPGFTLSDGEWALITGTADRVAKALKISTGAYDDQFYGPAFAALDQPGTCAAEGPKIAPLIKRLKSMGGSTDPIG
ncbi:MAG: hypothetical protein WBP18_05785 [Paracoccaceae bacterium]|jgi:hypothetical protein